MASKRRKPVRYPRKLRQTLERINPQRITPEDGPGAPLWRDILSDNTVDHMHARIDNQTDDPRFWKLVVRHTLRPEINLSRLRRPKPIVVRPPWKLRDETPGSEE